MNDSLGVVVFGGFMFVFLIAIAIVLPDNALTGNVIQETCEDGLCLELCDSGSDEVCDDGMVCCFTHWESGVCASSGSCESIREMSLYQSIELYQDGVRTKTPPIDLGSLVFPLLLCAAIITYFVLQRSEKFNMG